MDPFIVEIFTAVMESSSSSSSQQKDATDQFRHLGGEAAL